MGEDTEAAFKELEVDDSYPVAMLLIGSGFFLVAFVEISATKLFTSGNGHSHHDVEIFDDYRQSKSAIYTMVFGLSAHSIFEGLAIGLQTDSRELWTLALVVLIHKSL